MNTVSTTQIRTKISKVVKDLSRGEEFTLIHRSEIVGSIIPKKYKKNKIIDSKRFASTLKSLEPSKKMTHKQLMKMYEHYMMYRHGPRLS